jgi:membrane-associated phospholipid phosphatase
MSVMTELQTAVPEPLENVQSPPWSGTLVGLRWLVLGLVVLGSAAFAVDLSVSQWMHTHQGLKVLHQPLQVVEGLGDATGFVLVLVTLYLVSKERRRELLRMLCTVVAAGLMADLIKFCIARTRPRSYPGDGLLQLQSVTETFHGWFPFLHSGSLLINSKFQSFPSAHTATGAALAVALTRLYPQAGWWFGFLAAAVALQRVETGAHYLSDTCFGGAVGILVALQFQYGTAWSKWFDRFETR